MSIFLDFKAENRGKAKRADNTQSILVKPLIGIADTANDFVIYIINTAENINQAVIFVISHGVHGEIAARKVCFDIGDKRNIFGVSVILILAVGAKCSYFKRFAIDNRGDRAVFNARFDTANARGGKCSFGFNRS